MYKHQETCGIWHNGVRYSGQRLDLTAPHRNTVGEGIIPSPQRFPVSRLSEADSQVSWVGGRCNIGGARKTGCLLEYSR